MKKESGISRHTGSSPHDGKAGRYGGCNVCGSRLNRWDTRLSKALAYKRPVCEKCMAKEYGMDVEAFRGRMEDYFDLRPCRGI